MVIKNLENKIRLTGIVCTAFLVGCVIISVSSIWTARTMVTDAHKKVYVLDGNVPILVRQTTMEETLDVEAKSHVEMFHHYFFTLAPDDKYIRYTMEKAMYLVDETGLAQYNTLKEKGFYSNILGTSASGGRDRTGTVQHPQGERLLQQHPRDERGLLHLLRQHPFRCGQDGVHLLRTAAHRAAKQHPDARACHRRTAQAGAPARTENNPHGLLIVNWRTLLNKDIEQKTKNNY